ncbi:MAG TPA: LysM peptidoglycan-binding domain-containing protein [Patescibacteria group bacterium]
MDLKSILKTLKLNESTISTVLGAIVILVLGVFVINYFKHLPSNQLPSTALTTENNIQTTHKVAKGETLSQIAFKYYKSGDWKQIADANNITDPNVIEVGQELKIPVEQTETPIAQATPAETPVPTTPTFTPTPVATPTASPSATPAVANPNEAISAATYKVVKGDSLWKISVRAYGDGYKWVQIAKANKLHNPDLIHPGNIFVLPR